MSSSSLFFPSSIKYAYPSNLPLISLNTSDREKKKKKKNASKKTPVTTRRSALAGEIRQPRASTYSRRRNRDEEGESNCKTNDRARLFPAAPVFRNGKFGLYSSVSFPADTDISRTPIYRRIEKSRLPDGRIATLTRIDN